MRTLLNGSLVVSTQMLIFLHLKNTIRDVGNTALLTDYTVYNVYTVYIVYTFYTVYVVANVQIQLMYTLAS